MIIFFIILFYVILKIVMMLSKITKITDQPGRIAAIGLASPLLLYKGFIYNDNLLKIFAYLLFFWDLYWLMFKDPACIN
jgi:hypothetical protein